MTRLEKVAMFHILNNTSKRFTTQAVLIACVVILQIAIAPHLQAEQSQRPNIILILADDLGYGDLGCYGQSQLETPNLDRMASEGMRFTQFYAGDTVCGPSRCVLMTGLHTGHCRVRGNSPGLMLPEDVTLPEVLKQAGYKTACIGKWGVGHPPPLNDPNVNGFQHFYGYVSMFHAHNFYPEFLILNGERDPLRNVVMEKWKDDDGRGVATKKVDYVPDILTDRVVDYLDDHAHNSDKSAPFFLYYALNVPHANNEGGRFNDAPEKGMEVPTFGEFAKKEWPGPEKGFAAIMQNIDRDVGRVFAKLKELGMDEETLVLFTSDNGPHQEGGHIMEFFDSNGQLRGMKRDLYEGGIRVPLIARWPGTIAANTKTLHIGAFEDLLPTFAELAEIEAPKEIDGISFLPTLKGEPAQQLEHEFLYWEFSERGGKRAVRQGDWKLVQTDVSLPAPNSPELYNLGDDLAETNDIAQEHPAVVQKLMKLMETAHIESDAYPLFADEKRD